MLRAVPKEPSTYGRAVLSEGYRKCEQAVIRQCREILEKRFDYANSDADSFLDAEWDGDMEIRTCALRISIVTNDCSTMLGLSVSYSTQDETKRCDVGFCRPDPNGSSG